MTFCVFQVNFLVSSLSASNLTVDNLSVKNVEYSKVDRCSCRCSSCHAVLCVARPVLHLGTHEPFTPGRRGVRNIVRAGVFEVRV